MDHLPQAYARASKRLFLLDYDGTLTDIKPRPQDATPTPALIRILKQLSAAPENTVVIISGRSRYDLDTWFGTLDLGLAAEHGAFTKEAHGNWLSHANAATVWQHQVLPIMDDACQKLPGSLVNTKEASITWHYRCADQTAAGPIAKTLCAKLQAAIAPFELTVMQERKAIEVKSSRFTKGTAAERWLAAHAYGFVCAAGDDTTDEELFAALPPDSYSIKVGHAPSVAKGRVEAPDALLTLLQKLL